MRPRHSVLLEDRSLTVAAPIGAATVRERFPARVNYYAVTVPGIIIGSRWQCWRWRGSSPPAPAGAQEVKDTFRIKYVAEGAVYIEGGRTAGLAEKMRLTVSKGADVTIELEVVSVADSSAVCEIRSPGAPPKPGDYAKLSSEDAQKSQILQKMGVFGGKLG